MEKEQDIKKIHQKIVDEINEKPLKWFRDTLDLEHEGDIENKVLCFLLMLATYFDVISQVLLTGESSSGKSSLLNACRNMLPRDDYLYLIGATESSIRNAEDMLDDVRFLIFTEFDAVKSGQDNSLDFILRMLSADDSGGDFLKSEQVGKDWKPTKVRLKPKSYFSTYAKGTHGIGNENLNRLWIIEPEQSEDKTKSVISNRILLDEFQDEIMSKEYKLRSEVFVYEFLKKKFQTNQFVTKEVFGDVKVKDKDQFGREVEKTIRCVVSVDETKILIPYRSTLLYMFKEAKETRATRDIKRFLTLISIITKLHVCLNPDSRAFIETDNFDPAHKGKIKWFISEPQDFILACELSWLTIQQNMRNLTEADINLYQTLIEMEIEREQDNKILDEDKEEGFTPKEISQRAGISYEYARKRIYNLAKYGLLKAGTFHKNSSKRTYTWVSEITNDTISDWWIYEDLIETDCKQVFERYNINKGFEKYYTIYNNPDERPVNKFSKNHERLETLSTLRTERIKKVRENISWETKQKLEFYTQHKQV